MSVFWQNNHAGSDGDSVYGRLLVDQWAERAEFAQRLAQEIRATQEAMLAEYDRLRALGDA